MKFDDSFLLLGAGASAGRVPLAIEFVKKIREHLNGFGSPSREVILKAFDEVVGSLERQLNAPVGLEPFFEAIDDCLDAQSQDQDSPNRIRPSRALERIHYETKRVIQQQCDVSDRSRSDYLVPLLRLLRAARSYPIVSFNYDNIIENACLSGGFTFGECVLGEQPQQCDFELVKVHGSVGWLPNADRIGLRRSARHSIAVMREFGELRSATTETPLIYPSRRKMPMQAPFMRNAIRLQELLQTKRTCIVVGYSFPDLHVRTWLSDAFRANQKLVVYLVAPLRGNPALNNLIGQLPTLPWGDRLFIVDKRFGDAIEDGFDLCLERALPFGAAHFAAQGIPAQPKGRILHAGRVSGLGASRDGKTLYAAGAAGKKGLLKIDIATGALANIGGSLRDPRGIATTEDGRILVVQNRFMRLGPVPTLGAGTILEIAANGRKRNLTNLHLSDVRSLAIDLLRGRPWSELRTAFRSLLSWPTDVAWRSSDGAIFATEARSLVRIRDKAEPERICEPELAFNFHGIDVADDGAVVGVELGVGQAYSWGRVARFSFEDGRVSIARGVELEGQRRLMALCFAQSLRKTVITQTLAWPLGALIFLDYPSMANARIARGFDMPQKIEYVPHSDQIVLSTRHGVTLLPIGEIYRQAVPMDVRPKLAFYSLK